jgi:lipopolysaccharide transport system permease protein
MIVPLLMMVVYTFVFSVVFEARWGNSSGSSKVEFALIIFSGMMVFNFFSEVLNRSTNIIISNVNYVKKVLFPLEVLPSSIVVSALIHALINLVILLIAILLANGTIHLTVLFLPIVLLPVILMCFGLSWFLAAIGTYVRDIIYVINIITSALMFLSPIFYPITAVPESLRFLFYINPLSYTVEDVRKVLLWGQVPDFGWLLTGSLIGMLIAVFGYICFRKLRRGFSDVL